MTTKSHAWYCPSLSLFEICVSCSLNQYLISTLLVHFLVLFFFSDSHQLEAFGGCFFFVLGTVVAICVIYIYFFAPVLVIGCLYYYIQQYFVKSSLELQRLESVSKSPIFSHFGESLTGAGSLRAYGVHYLRRCLDASLRLLDANHRNVLTSQLIQCWLAVRLETCSTILTVLCAVYAVATRSSANAGLVGLSIVYALTITSFLNGAVRLGSMIEGLMSSVQRVHEYSQLPSEAAPETDVALDQAWPAQGAIEFKVMLWSCKSFGCVTRCSFLNLFCCTFIICYKIISIQCVRDVFFVFNYFSSSSSSSFFSSNPPPGLLDAVSPRPRSCLVQFDVFHSRWRENWHHRSHRQRQVVFGGRAVSPGGGRCRLNLGMISPSFFYFNFFFLFSLFFFLFLSIVYDCARG